MIANIDIYFLENTKENMSLVIDSLNDAEKKYKVKGKGVKRKLTFKGNTEWLYSLSQIKDFTFWA